MLAWINESFQFLSKLAKDAIQHDKEIAAVTEVVALAQPELITKLKKSERPLRFTDIHPERWKGQGKRKKVMK